jgi:hypothetical protein
LPRSYMAVLPVGLAGAPKVVWGLLKIMEGKTRFLGFFFDRATARLLNATWIGRGRTKY